ncbi:hypothetical protein GCM10028818_22730 [Spirosoma horti]
MRKSSASHTKKDLNTLRHGIQNRYKEFHLLDKVTYPDFEYNSNRANYEPLRNSFVEEFFVIRGIDRVNNTLHIPSTSTLVQIFCEDDYIPNKKILNTCYAYVEGTPKVASGNSMKELAKQETTVIPKRTFTSYIVIGLVIFSFLMVIAVYLAIPQQISSVTPGELILKRPFNGQTVPMKVKVEGNVTNADTVWPVVCDIRDTIYHAPAYYVQNPILVPRGSNSWKGEVHIGGPNKLHIGAKAIIRVFVNPTIPLTVGERLYSWPQAELSSAGTHVVRGFYHLDFANNLIIEQPTNHQTVPMKILIEGTVKNVDIVWTVVHNLTKGGYYVQAPSKVEKNGRWRGPVYIGGLDKSSLGSHYQIRAFVNPSTMLKEGDEIYAWPEADLSSDPIEVVRGSNHI